MMGMIRVSGRGATDYDSWRGRDSDGARSIATEVVIYHNPACATSRKVLGMIREAGIEPRVIEYLKTPPSRRSCSICCGGWT